MSWPADDPLGVNSDNAAYRCMPMQRGANGYTYEEAACSSNDAGICEGCDECHYSWPLGDPLGRDSAEGMCRCKPSDDLFDEREISYGMACTNNYDELCGADCADCRNSWPRDDPRKWESEDAICRCKQEDFREITFGNRCASLTDGQCGTHCRECHMSWESTDTAGARGPTADCRCKSSW